MVDTGETANLPQVRTNIFFSEIYLILFDLVGGGAPHPLGTVMS
jgi:hypothetical protein